MTNNLNCKHCSAHL